MSGFNSKRQASKSLLDPQSAKEVTEEQSWDTGLWFVATTASEAHLQAALRRLTVAVEGTHPDPWREAIDAQLFCLHLGTVESFPTAQEALDALIDWHVAVALDPTVSSDAQALVDRGAAAAEPLTERELELIDGMIEVQLHHAKRTDIIHNRTMAERQKGWDMERVELLRKLRDIGIKGSAK